MSLIGLSVQSAGHALGAERALGRGAVGIVSQREEDEKLEVKKGNERERRWGWRGTLQGDGQQLQSRLATGGLPGPRSLHRVI